MTAIDPTHAGHRAIGAVWRIEAADGRGLEQLQRADELRGEAGQ